MGRRAEGEGRLKVRLLSVGKDRSGLFAPAVDEYAGRIAHYASLELIELSSKASKVQEGVAILSKRTDRDWLVTLDERGQLFSSRELAQFIGRAQNEGRNLLFVVGGDEGLSDEVVAASKLTLSLSRMTLPHRLARLVIAEQIYRAFTLLKGEPYHK